jgi:hypothetical protein
LLSLPEAILVIILVREARFLISLLKGHDPWYVSPIFSWLVIILVHEDILIVIPTGGHLGYYRSTGGQQSTVEEVEDLRRHGMSPG